MDMKYIDKDKLLDWIAERILEYNVLLKEEESNAGYGSEHWATYQHSISMLWSFKEQIESLSTQGKVDDSEQVILPTPLEDENFIEQEISYQHHGVVRGAIYNYKSWLRERKLLKK